MRTKFNLRRLLPARLRRFVGDDRGIAAVEFALLLPVMIPLYLCFAEISQAVSIDRKISLTTRTVADLVAQGTTITSTEMTNYLNAAKTVFAPYSDTALKVVVSSITIDANSVAKIDWSVATSNTSARTKGSTVSPPAGLVTPKTSIIWAEVNFDYTPAIGYLITGKLPLSDTIYMRPRQQDTVCYIAC